MQDSHSPALFHSHLLGHRCHWQIAAFGSDRLFKYVPLPPITRAVLRRHVWVECFLSHNLPLLQEQGRTFQH